MRDVCIESERMLWHLVEYHTSTKFVLCALIANDELFGSVFKGSSMTIEPSNFVFTPYYHGVYRCVQGAVIDGVDPHSGRKVTHRRRWFEERLALLERHFCIKILRFAMGSHSYQIVLEINTDKLSELSNHEVFARWIGCYECVNPIVRSYLAGDKSIEHEALQILSSYQQRLGDCGWFLSALNQYVAYKANEEDNQSGHFWETSKLRPLQTDDAKNKALNMVESFASVLEEAC